MRGHSWNVDSEVVMEGEIGHGLITVKRVRYEPSVKDYVFVAEALPKLLSDAIQYAFILYSENFNEFRDMATSFLEFLIGFNSQGYEDPGICTGPVENCYPPEGDEERIILSIEVLIHFEETRHSLRIKIQDAVGKSFEFIPEESRVVTIRNYTLWKSAERFFEDFVSEAEIETS